MTKRLKHFRVTLDEETARWVRAEADKRDTSVSMLLVEILRAEMQQEAQYEAAQRTYLAQEPGIHRFQNQPRKELHDQGTGG